MNSDSQHSNTPATNFNSGEETLRLIASLPAPAGLEERMHAALRQAPSTARVLAWPVRFYLEKDWMRAAAAAAIVCVVAGGCWGVYSRVEQAQSGKVVTMPAAAPAARSFSNAGAIRTPQTRPGPGVPQAAKKPAAPKKGQRVKPRANQAAPLPAASR